MHSHYVPISHKPLAPNKDTHRQLFSAIGKKKVKESQSLHYEKPDNKEKREKAFIEDIRMKTMTIM